MLAKGQRKQPGRSSVEWAKRDAQLRTSMLHGHREMLTLFISVEGKPGKDVVVDPDQPVDGYYQTLGVTARSEEELRTIVQQFLTSDLGSTLVEISERWSPDFYGSDADLKDEVGDLDKVGVWYSSGRAWFGPE
jgi:hypothetical protein